MMRLRSVAVGAALLVLSGGLFGCTSSGMPGRSLGPSGGQVEAPTGAGGTEVPPISTVPPAQPAGCQPGQAADYFPYHLGTEATYAGKGNEYASFKLKVVHEVNGKVEWRKDNGGTIMAEVYRVAPQEVTLVYREGEAYDNNPRMDNPPNQSEAILKGPIQVGTEWTEGNRTHRITAVDASVQALGNETLNCVVVVEIQSPESLIQNYYHRQYGWVLSVFDPNGSAIESRLATFTPNPEGAGAPGGGGGGG